MDETLTAADVTGDSSLPVLPELPTRTNVRYWHQLACRHRLKPAHERRLLGCCAVIAIIGAQTKNKSNLP